MQTSGVTCTGCTAGIEMCSSRPCFGTPEEFEKIIEAGFADKLRIDYYYRGSKGKKDIEFLTGAAYEQDVDKWLELKRNPEFKITDDIPYKTIYSHYSPFWPGGRCVLLTEDNKCSLHELDLKPEQGRQACCKEENDTAKDNEYYAKLWNTKKGRALVKRFKEMLNI